MQIAQVIILHCTTGVELERKKPAHVCGRRRVAGRGRQRMKLHNSPLNFAPRRWQLLGVGGAEHGVNNSDRMTACHQTCVNSLQANSSSLKVCRERYVKPISRGEPEGFTLGS